MQIVYRPRHDLKRVPAHRDDRSFTATSAAVKKHTEFFGEPELGGDFEDFRESFAQLVAAIDTGLPVYCSDPADPDKTVKAFNTKRDHPERTLPTIKLCHLLKSDALEGTPGWPQNTSLLAAERYAWNSTFSHLAGRPCVLSAAWDKDDTRYRRTSGVMEVHQAISDMAFVHGPAVLVKQVSDTKQYPNLRLTIEEPSDLAAIRRQMFEHFDYGMIHSHMGVPHFLVQKFVKMTHEYRVVVINGKAVAGAGCIEKFCPPYNLGFDFDPTFEVVRNSGEIEYREALATRMANYAELCAAQMMIYNPGARTGIYDIAMVTQQHGEPKLGLIEVNPVGNFGLYAINMKPVIAAMVDDVARQIAAQNNLDQEIA
jgi:hypothetical protein